MQITDMRNVLFAMLVVALIAAPWTPWPGAFALPAFAFVLWLDRRAIVERDEVKDEIRTLHAWLARIEDRVTDHGFRISEALKKLEEKPNPDAEDQAAALKALGLLFAKLDSTVQELQTEVNGINLARGIKGK